MAASQGDHLSVPKGVTHCFRNPTDKIVRVLNSHQPALKMENYFEDVCRVLDKLTDQGRKRFRMNLRTVLYMSVLMNNYRGEIIAKSPPDVAIKALGWVAKVLGLQY